MDLTGIDSCLLTTSRPADAIAHVAHCGCAADDLTAFAGKRPGAARRHYRHVAGVEVGAECGHY
jgi:hypothetical protein